MNNRFKFRAIVKGYYYIDTPEKCEEFKPLIFLENVDVLDIGDIGLSEEDLEITIRKQYSELSDIYIERILENFRDNSNGIDTYITITPERVYQSTGLKDKNGNLIYEGDIVEVQYIGSQIPLFKNEYSKEPETERFEIFCHPEWLKFYAKNDNYRKTCEIHSLDLERIRVNDYNKVYEVIGNIYENKDLL